MALRAARSVDWVRIAPGLMSFAVVASVGLADGGLVPRTWRLAGIGLLAVAAAALLVRGRIALSRLEVASVAVFGGYAAWIALSALWSGRPADSLVMAERALLYTVAVFAVFAVAERDSVRQLLIGVLGGITAVSAYGLTEYVVARPPLDPFEGELLYQPLGYANGLGIFATIGIVLGVGLALATPRRLPRVALLMPVAVLVPTLYLTSSRGAWLALGAGLACIFCFRGAGGVRPAVLVALLAVAAVCLVVASTGVSLGELSGGLRVDYWQVAWQEYARNPALGSGAGTYVDYWLELRPHPSFTRTAHSLYLQSLAELGPAGLALVAAALGVPLTALRRRRDPLLVAAAGAYVAYLFHAGIDWDWELPAATIPGLVCGASMLVSIRSASTPHLQDPARRRLVVAAVALAMLACLRLATGPGLPLGFALLSVQT